jgi:hypothetical protein
MLPPTATISFTALWLMSATKTLPAPSTVTPRGEANPLPSVRMVGLGGMLPPTATISFTALWEASATKTSPASSTATAKGLPKPLPSVLVAVFPGKATSGPVPVPVSSAVPSTTVSVESTNCTAPSRCSGFFGVNV